MYLYRAIDSAGDTVELFFSEYRDLLAAKHFLRKALERHGRPERIVVDGSQTNHEAIVSCDAENRLQDRSRRSPKSIRIHKSKYLNNRIEQDHRCIKRRVRSMLGFKSMASAEVILSGIEMVHMMRKRQASFTIVRVRRSQSSSKPSPSDHQRESTLSWPKSQFATEPPMVPSSLGYREREYAMGAGCFLFLVVTVSKQFVYIINDPQTDRSP